MKFPAAEFFQESPDVVAVPIVPQGELIPVEEESYNHTARVVKVGPDDLLYVSLGQPFNVASAGEARALQGDRHRRHHPHEPGRRGARGLHLRASGTRSATTSTPRPANSGGRTTRSTAWATTSRPGRSTVRPRPGSTSVTPGTAAARPARPEYEGEEVPVDVVMPVSETIAHAADLGMMFYTGNMFPEKYENAIFSAQHGSWNRTEPGRRACHGHVHRRRGQRGRPSRSPRAGSTRTASTTGGRWTSRCSRTARLLVSDDLASAVYRISYSADE